jgi:hypothetical protein
MENVDLSPLDKARAALSEKESASQRYRDLVAKVEKEADELRTVVKWLETLERGSEPTKPSGRVTKAQRAADFATDVLDLAGPQPIAFIYDRFIGAGNELSGKTESEKRVTLSGYLNRDPRLKYYKAHGRWWYAGQPYPGLAAAKAEGHPMDMDVAGIHNPIHTRNMELKYGAKPPFTSSEKAPAKTFSTIVAEMERQTAPSSSNQWGTVAPALKK